MGLLEWIGLGMVAFVVIFMVVFAIKSMPWWS